MRTADGRVRARKYWRQTAAPTVLLLSLVQMPLFGLRDDARHAPEFIIWNDHPRAQQLHRLRAIQEQLRRRGEWDAL